MLMSRLPIIATRLGDHQVMAAAGAAHEHGSNPGNTQVQRVGATGQRQERQAPVRH